MYPIFIPSRGRYENNITANMLLNVCLPFYLVVEAKEYQAYVDKFGKKRVLNLGGSDYGGVEFARNFIKKYAKEKLKAKRHWQLDDDIGGLMEVQNRVTLSTDVIRILTKAETFVDQFKNIAIAGLSSNVFGRLSEQPVKFNKFAYTCMLIKSDLPYEWIKGVEDDLDFNLQCLTAGWCTVQFSMFLFKWTTTGTLAGGYTDLYAEGRRLKRQQNTLRKWPQYLTKLAPKSSGGYRIVTN
jgi:hypothetical protein